MDVQVEAVSEFAQYRLEGAWFEADSNYLVIVREYDQVDFLVLYGYVCERSALFFQLGQRVQDHWWYASHEFPIIGLRC